MHGCAMLGVLMSTMITVSENLLAVSSVGLESCFVGALFMALAVVLALVGLYNIKQEQTLIAVQVVAERGLEADALPAQVKKPNKVVRRVRALVAWAQSRPRPVVTVVPAPEIQALPWKISPREYALS